MLEPVKKQTYSFFFLCSVERASLYNETNLVHDLFLMYFVNFIYNLHISDFQPREALSTVVCKLTFSCV